MKVLLISPTSPIGGIATWTNEVINSEYKENIILVDTGKKENRRSFKSIISDIFKTFLVAIKCLFEQECDIAHINSSCSTFGMIREILWIKCLKHRKKIVVEFHCDVSIYCKSPFKTKLLNIILNNIDTCLVLNEFSMKYIQNLSNVKCVFFPNFINITRKYNYVVRDEIRKIIYLGRICKDKGTDVIQEIAKQFPNITFELTGPKEENIEITEKNIIINDPVSKEDVIDYLKTGDLLLFPSNAEGFPMIYLEAMLAGIPILTNNVGSASYIFLKLEYSNLILVNSNSIVDYIRNIKELNSKIIRQKISSDNFKCLNENYSKNTCLEKLFDIYKEVYFGFL